MQIKLSNLSFPRKRESRKILAVLCLLFFIATPIFAHAAGITIDTSNPLTLGLPGAKDPNEYGIPGIVYNIYQLALLLGGILAFGSIIYGGIMYLTQQGSGEAQSMAKSRITDAIIGLLLLLGIYGVLNFVNPNLTHLQFPSLDRLKGPIPLQNNASHTGYQCLDANGKEVSNTCYSTDNCDNKCTGEGQKCGRAPKADACVGAGQAGVGGYGYKGVAIPAGTLTDAAARGKLSQAGISVNKSDCQNPPSQACISQQYSSCESCTSLDGIPQSAVDGLIGIKNRCEVKGLSCSIVVTGGTEAGHATHKMGVAVVDISSQNKDTNNYINFTTDQTQWSHLMKRTGDDGVSYTYENFGAKSTAPHWHLSF